MTATVLTFMATVQAMMALAPDVIAFAGKVKGWIDDMFSAGIITADEQNALHARVTDVCRNILNGNIPPHWQVEADPVPDSPQAPV